MASPVLEGLLSHYQSLGVASSTHRTYQTGLRAFQQFCYQFSIPAIPASPLTLRYFCCSIAHTVSHKTIKVYLAGIRLEHIERGLQDPTNNELLRLLCKGIKRYHGTNRRTRLPITINILRTLKCKLREETSYSLLEKRLLWSAFTLAFYGFLRTSEFTTPELTWSHIQRHTDKVVVFIQQSNPSAKVTSWQSMPQRHLPALFEPLISMLLQLQLYKKLVPYLMGVDSPPSHVSSSHQHSITCCSTRNITSNTMPAIALE